jgi:hypothetical protein
MDFLVKATKQESKCIDVQDMPTARIWRKHFPKYENLKWLEELLLKE